MSCLDYLFLYKEDIGGGLAFAKEDQLGGGFKYFLFSPRTLGRWSNLTNIFQMGCNRQLVKFLLDSPQKFDLAPWKCFTPDQGLSLSIMASQPTLPDVPPGQRRVV